MSLLQKQRFYPLVAVKYNVAIQYLNFVINKSHGAALKSLFSPGWVSCTISDMCVCFSKQLINIELQLKTLMHQHTGIGVCIVGAR